MGKDQGDVPSADLSHEALLESAHDYSTKMERTRTLQELQEIGRN